MNKILISLLLMFSFNGNSQNKYINIDISATERFYELMNYIENSNGKKLQNKQLSIEQISDIFNKNAKDSTRQIMIESLLETRPYSHNYIEEVKCFDKSGKDAYRIVYNIIGDGITEYITSDMLKKWGNFWNSKQRKMIDLKSLKNIESTININEEKFISNLPEKAFNKSKYVTLYFTIDGNRSAYQEDSVIVFDLINNKIDDNQFLESVTHELHHIYYSDWLEKNITSNPFDKDLRDMQFAFIMEGVAQRINFDTYPDRIKKLYSNKELLQELMNDLKTGKFEMNHDEEISMLNKYISSPKEKEYSYRPSILYYLSYNIYRSIEKAGGKEMLEYVVENPKELISTYNKLYNENDMLFEPFSDEFEQMWSGNL